MKMMIMLLATLTYGTIMFAIGLTAALSAKKQRREKAAKMELEDQPKLGEDLQ